MKKLICILLSALLILTLFSACGKQPAAEDETNLAPAEDEAEDAEDEPEPAPKPEGMVRCVFCGAAFPKDSLICPACGKKR